MNQPMSERRMTAEQRAAFRRFVRAHHPDVGGDPLAFTAGLARLRAEAAAPYPDERRFDGPVTFVSNRRRRQEAVLRALRKLDRILTGRLRRRVE